MKALELFAGVGGFRLGLEKAGHKVVWSNQWEPGTKKQWASEIYEARFGKDGHSNQDINEVPVDEIPEADLLVGGFPCQDYSVAATSDKSKGLAGKKGVLWWSIYNILEKKGESAPRYLMLENVDRLLKSPSKQRGRDFGVILKSLDMLGYTVEWKVINAAEYGMPQKRRRTFIMAYKKGSDIESRIQDPLKWIESEGTIAKAFPSTRQSEPVTGFLSESILDVSDSFAFTFENAGMMRNGEITTFKTAPLYIGKMTVLADIMQSSVAPEFYIEDETKWKWYKSSKKEKRVSPQGFEYWYSEGALPYPDPTDRPARTLLTNEGSRTASRTKHAIHDGKGVRILTPIEMERINMFPDDHTLIPGISNSKRGFMMGNALVVGIVERLGAQLAQMETELV